VLVVEKSKPTMYSFCARGIFIFFT